MSRTSTRPVRLPRTGSVPTFIGIGVIAMGALLFGLSPSFNPLDVFRGFTSTVPDVVGLSQPRALLDLQSAHFEGAVRFEYSNETPRGLVAGQEPGPGTVARRGSEVTIAVSRGPALVPVPELVGVERSEAEEMLGELGLDPVVETADNELVPAGLVISQEPPAGRILLGGAEVNIVVSNGPAVRPVPEVVGVTIEGAAFRVGQAGLAIGELSLAEDPNVPVGAVISSTPAQGEVVERDTEVAIVVSSGLPAVAVPDVVGMSEADAADQLALLGLLVGQVIEPGQGTDGRVVAQEPAAGTPLKPSSIVTLTVRDATPPPRTSSSSSERGGDG